MTKDELIARLGKYEWNDVEFKKAQRGVPESAYETVSAFANTDGGWLVFGVLEGELGYEIVGVDDVDKVQNDFLSCLRSQGKLNRPVDAKADAIDFEGRTVLTFHIPETQRTDKPVYLRGDIRRSYIRRGAGDERCTQREIERFLRDATPQPFDNEVIEGLDENDFYDERTLSWYRQCFNEREPGRQETLNDREFLLEWGFLIDRQQQLLVTRTALLLFGKARFVRQYLSRPIVDFQIIHQPFEHWSADQRWADRIVVEDNILQGWLAIVDRYMKHADRPFEIDAATLRRHDEPPDYISFREAAINLLIHQDYGDTGRHAQIQIFHDRTRFWNPGDAFQGADHLLEPGAKELRNPNIVGALRRIGLSDQAGTGIRAIFRNWRQLGNDLPQINNQRSEKAFELLLVKELLLTETQKRFQKELGAHLDDQQAALLAYACRHGRLTLTQAKAITGLHTEEASDALKTLIVQVLLKGPDSGNTYHLADQLRERYAKSSQKEESSTKAGPESGPESRLESGLESETAYLILKQLVQKPLSRSEIATSLGHSSVSGAVNRGIKELLKKELIAYTIPDKPNSRLQKYQLTDKGRQSITGAQGE